MVTNSSNGVASVDYMGQVGDGSPEDGCNSARRVVGKNGWYDVNPEAALHVLGGLQIDFVL